MVRSSIHEKATLLGSAVFAANDGLITTFAVVAGAYGASLPDNVVKSGLEIFLLGGFAAMIAYLVGLFLKGYL